MRRFWQAQQQKQTQQKRQQQQTLLTLSNQSSSERITECESLKFTQNAMGINCGIAVLVSIYQDANCQTTM